MPETVLYGGIILIIIIILWFTITNVLRNKKIGNPTIHLSIDIDCLIDALGGLTNIENMEATNSKASFILKDSTSAQITVLKELGATGIVQSNQKITAIFGKASKEIVEAIKTKR